MRKRRSFGPAYTGSYSWLRWPLSCISDSTARCGVAPRRWRRGCALCLALPLLHPLSSLSLSLLSSLFFDDLPLESTVFLPCLPFSHPRPLPRSSAPLPFASCLPAQRPARREPSFVGVHLPSLSLSLSLSLLSPYFSFSSRGRRYGEPRDLPSSSHHPGWLDGTNKRAQNTRRNSSNREFLFPLFEQMPWC